ncbi:MAG: glycosyltransferase [Acidimicrobiaceae bacterium]|nr:glycosyltransferase [Acidimicrobiaceae bacterium]
MNSSTSEATARAGDDQTGGDNVGTTNARDHRMACGLANTSTGGSDAGAGDGGDDSPDTVFSTVWPSVSVVIPAYKCASHIRGCVSAVAAQKYSGHIDITVALAQSPDNTEQTLAKTVREIAVVAPKLPIRIVDNPHISTSAGLNTAIANSRGQIIARVDAQSRIPPNYIQQAVTTMLRTKAANVGGVQRPSVSKPSARSPLPAQTGKASATAIAAALSSPFGGGPAAYRQAARTLTQRKLTSGKLREKPAAQQHGRGDNKALSAQQHHRDFASTNAIPEPDNALSAQQHHQYPLSTVRQCNYDRCGGHAVDTVYLGVFNRQALQSVGGFDESLMRNQDYELNWRLRRAGYVVWLDPSLVVDYTPRDNYRDLATQYFRYGAWKRAVLLRHPKSLKLRQLAAPLLLIATVISGMELARKRLRGTVVPLLYISACIQAAFKLRFTLPKVKDRFRAGWTFSVIHFSWASGFLVGRTRSTPHIQ